MSEIKTFRLDIKPSEAGSEAGNEGGAAMGPKRISIDNLMVSGGVGGADVGGAAPNEPNATGGVDERKNGEAVDSAAAAAAAADDGASRRAEEREAGDQFNMSGRIEATLLDTESFKHVKGRETEAGISKLGNNFFARSLAKLESGDGNQRIPKTTIASKLALDENHFEELKRRKEMLMIFKSALNTFLNVPQSSKLAFLFNLFMTCCIFGSVVALLLETVPAANEKPHANTNPTDIMEWLDGTSGHSINGKKFLELLDHVFTSVFTVELFARMIAAESFWFETVSERVRAFQSDGKQNSEDRKASSLTKQSVNLGKDNVNSKNSKGLPMVAPVGGVAATNKLPFLRTLGKTKSDAASKLSGTAKNLLQPVSSNAATKDAIEAALADSYTPFFKDAFNWLDIVSVAPYYIELALGKLAGIGIIRLIRVLRIFKICRRFDGTEVLVEACRRTYKPLMLPVILFIMFSYFFGAILYFLEPCYNINECAFNSITDGFYFTIVTTTTVGYGDQVPTGIWARVLSLLMMTLGIFFLSMPLSVIGTEFDTIWSEFVIRQEKAKKRNERTQNKAGKLLLKKIKEKKRGAGGAAMGGGNMFNVHKRLSVQAGETVHAIEHVGHSMGEGLSKIGEGIVHPGQTAKNVVNGIRRKSALLKSVDLAMLSKNPSSADGNGTVSPPEQPNPKGRLISSMQHLLHFRHSKSTVAPEPTAEDAEDASKSSDKGDTDGKEGKDGGNEAGDAGVKKVGPTSIATNRSGELETEKGKNKEPLTPVSPLAPKEINIDPNSPGRMVYMDPSSPVPPGLAAPVEGGGTGSFRKKFIKSPEAGGGGGGGGMRAGGLLAAAAAQRAKQKAGEKGTAPATSSASLLTSKEQQNSLFASAPNVSVGDGAGGQEPSFLDMNHPFLPCVRFGTLAHGLRFPSPITLLRSSPSPLLVRVMLVLPCSHR